MGSIKRSQKSKSHQHDSKSAQARVALKLVLAGASLVFLSCSQKPKNESKTTPLVLNKPALEFFEKCSRIDTRLDEIWILLCYQDTHPFRQELYEYSKVYKKFRRLTFQDGVISDLAVRDIENIYYASTYDQSKEQFIEILKGRLPGTDLYLKKRTQTYFERLSSHPGQEKFLTWSPDFQKLYFVQSHQGTDQIVSFNDSHQPQVLHVAKASEILSPIILSKEKNLYWIEYVATQKKHWLYRRTKNRAVALFTSASKIPLIKPDITGNNLLVSFSTGLGGEIWSFNPDSFCWQLRLRTENRWNHFEVLNDNEVFLSLTDGKGLQLQKLITPAINCEPSPPGLGVEKIL